MRLPLLLLFLLISFRIFSQSAITWSNEIDVATSNFSNQHPRIVTDANNNPVIIWGNFQTQQVFETKWNDTVFTPPVALNDSSMPVFIASWAGPDIANHGDTMYVVASQLPEDSGSILMFRSFDGGSTFGPAIHVENLPDSIKKLPAVATDSLGNPVVAFMELGQGSINPSYVVTRSNDFGNNFNPAQLASMYTGSYVADCAPGEIVCAGNNSAFLFRDDFSNFRTIWCGVSTDNSQTFPFGIPVDNTSWIINSCPLSGPDAVIIGDSVYTAFMSGASGDALCYISSASISGLWPGSTHALSDSVPGLSNQNFPAISNYNSRVAIVCRQTYNGTGQLVLFYSDDISSGIPSAFDTVSTGNIANGDIVLTDSAIYVVWQDDNSETVKFKKGIFSFTTGISHSTEGEITISPTAVTDHFTLHLKNNSRLKDLAIFDVNGKQVYSEVNGVTVKIPGAAPGIYFVKATSTDNNIFVQKIAVIE
jgi:hypothetical protein